MGMNLIEALRRTWNLGFSAALANQPASKQRVMLEADVQRVAAEYEARRGAQPTDVAWQPIETAPKDNKRPLFLARFNDDGTLQSFDYNGAWEHESESWEIPEIYYYWGSERGDVEEPSHWMYQPEWFAAAPQPPTEEP